MLSMRYLGIDYGSKRVGVALSDEAGSMGFPHTILPNTPRLVEELCALIAKESVGAVVVGESKDFSGVDNPIAGAARALALELADRAGVAVYFEPEVFTSVEARRAPSKEEKSRKPKSHDAIDDSAAALILTGFLTRQRER